MPEMEKHEQWMEYRLEQVIAWLLRAGVLLAAVVVLTGGVLYLAHQGHSRPDYHTFRGQSNQLRSLGAIIHHARQFDSQGIIQFGLLLLVLTPIVRVILSAVGFALEGDRLYVLMTLFVLAVLLYSLFAIH